MTLNVNFFNRVRDWGKQFLSRSLQSGFNAVKVRKIIHILRTIHYSIENSLHWLGWIILDGILHLTSQLIGNYFVSVWLMVVYSLQILLWV